MTWPRRVAALLDSLGEWTDLSDDEVVARLRQRNATAAEIADVLECIAQGDDP